MKKRKKRTNTKIYQKKQIKKAQRRCLKLWKECVKLRAGNCCEAPGCKEAELLAAHHIESYDLNPYLRYFMDNGLCLCAKKHHKFTKYSIHKSGLFILKIQRKFPKRFANLQAYMEEVELQQPVRDLEYYNKIENGLLMYVKFMRINSCS